jgi:FMN phosphatase YigB (HAD superfamily)
MDFLKDIRYLLLDAANTVIHKPSLWTSILNVLERYNYDVPQRKLQYHHKLLSEVYEFPDRTSQDFYRKFNADLLLSLGIIPNEQILEDIFSSCSNLPWECFTDTKWLNEINCPVGILSNFSISLISVLDNIYGNLFDTVIISEEDTKRKPDHTFFKLAVDKIGVSVSQILYIGDSLKLDIIPALSIGMRALLIDRLEVFGNRSYVINSMNDIQPYFQIRKKANF